MTERNYMNQSLSVEERVEDLLSGLTLMEKIGQMNQVWGLLQMKELGAPDPEEMARKGLAGSMLYVMDPAEKNRFQKIAIEESPSKIPILYGTDVVKGYTTSMPIMLAMAASFDESLLEEIQSVAACEARKDGTHWTFFPNSDIARDVRWGRVGETLGEDPYLSSRLVAAQVRGFQGETLDSNSTIMACVKHFAGYAACKGGRDYEEADISEAELRNVYLLPFKAGLDAGVGTVMSAYMDLNNIPATGNQFLMKKILRDEWNFNGFVVTDASTVGSMVTQGFAKDRKDAAYKAVKSSINMDMGSFCYAENLAALVQEGKVTEEEIDDAVRPILAAKFRLGLFEHPYVEEAGTSYVDPNGAKIARKAALKSLVLLKNEDKVLPLSAGMKKLAVVGPLADSAHDLEGLTGLGASVRGESLLTVLKRELPDMEIAYEPGPWIYRPIPNYISSFMPDFFGNTEKRNQTKEEANAALERAVAVSADADAVLCVMGETLDMAGESASRMTLDLPGRQQELLDRLADLGKPVILLVVGARPLSITKAAESTYVKAIVECWQLGEQGAEAVVDVLFGKYNPSGKLPITIPRGVGQCPCYYAHNRTQRPAEDQLEGFSRFADDKSSPLFPFGYGLSYSEFRYDNLHIQEETITADGEAVVSADVMNVGEMEGEETVQLYIHQRYGSDSRPVRLLKGFRKVVLKPGEKQTVHFKLGYDELSYWSTAQGRYLVEETEFDVWVGGDSRAALHGRFRVAE